MQRGKTQSLWWRVISRNVWYDEFAESTLQFSRNQHAATSQQRLVMVCTHVWTLLWQNPCIQTYPFYGRGIFSLNFGYKNSCKKDVFFFSASFFSPLLYKVRDLWRRGFHRILAGFLRIRKKISRIKPCCIKKRFDFCVCVSFIAIRSLLV